MFQIKICGVTTPADASCAVASGADAIGLNFYPASPRYLEPARADEIAAVLPSHVARVGVFVNAPARQVREIAQRLRLDYVQIHGDEPPEFLAELDGLATIRALRGTGDFAAVTEYLAHCNDLNRLPDAVLIDAYRAGQYGGTGDQANWSAIVRARGDWPEVPLILAGGLNPANVAAAIEQVRPAAVDTASGVEKTLGVKCPDRIAGFVKAARDAFAAVRGQ